MASRRRSEIIWSPSAERDLGRVYEYLKLDSPRRASRMVVRVVEAIDLLERQPELGAVAGDVEPVGRCRHLVVAPLRVIYQVVGMHVRILRIWDTRRDPRSLEVPPFDPNDESEG